MRQRTSGRESGLSTGIGLVAMVVGLALVAVVMLLGFNTFSGTGSNASTPSILSNSPQESQLKLCSEGRNSTYGNPPTSTQQAACIHQLLGQVGGAGAPSTP